MEGGIVLVIDTRNKSCLLLTKYILMFQTLRRCATSICEVFGGVCFASCFLIRIVRWLQVAMLDPFITFIHKKLKQN